jgi:hypothetical protein
MTLNTAATVDTSLLSSVFDCVCKNSHFSSDSLIHDYQHQYRSNYGLLILVS